MLCRPPGDRIQQDDDQRDFERAGGPGQSSLNELPKSVADQDDDRGGERRFPSDEAADNHQKQGQKIELNVERGSPQVRQTVGRDSMTDDEYRNQNKKQKTRDSTGPVGYVADNA